MKSKSTKISKKLFDRAVEEESVRNHLCLLELQLAELKKKKSYVTVDFYRTRIIPTYKGERYEHFYRIRFFIGVTNLKKLKPKYHRELRFLFLHPWSVSPSLGFPVSFSKFPFGGNKNK
ncbi:uncharacterized protein DS421_2g52270 [Arachis hypogaea]|nr:uncharacterized protein DS421_2g52270 [Arachis hypogaea]